MVNEAMVRAAFSDRHLYALPQGHRFPIEKYVLVKEQLLYEGTLADSQLYDPGLCPESAIVRTHHPDYWHALSTGALPEKARRKIGLPITATSVARARNSVAGTLAAARHALASGGVGINLGGGTHHAFRGHGEGFCLLNDIAIAANALIHEGFAGKILVIDLDVHQGNGTASLFARQSQVFTFSMHAAHNYPLHKENSDHDIALPTGTRDDEYLAALRRQLPLLLADPKPGLIFYQAGVDVIAGDKLGKLALTVDGCKQRDQLVLASARELGIPIVTTMGGGYADSLPRLIDAHCNTIRAVVHFFS